MSDEKTMDQVVAEISKESDRLTEVRVHEDETKELKTPQYVLYRHDGP